MILLLHRVIDCIKVYADCMGQTHRLCLKLFDSYFKYNGLKFMNCEMGIKSDIQIEKDYELSAEETGYKEKELRKIDE